MEYSEFQPLDTITFSEQTNADRATCTAHSLTNLVILAGGNVTTDEVVELKAKILSDDKPLSSDFDEEFIKSHGLISENLYNYFQTEILRPLTIEGVANGLISNLRIGPLLISIAPELSRRDRTIKAATEFDEKKADAHAVVATIRENLVHIIDPYKPHDTKQFDVLDDAQQLELVAWFTSTRARRSLKESDAILNKSNILEESMAKLLNPDTADRYLAETLSYTKPLLAYNSK